MPTDHPSSMNKLDPERTQSPGSRNWLATTARLLLVLAIFAAGGGISIYWMTHRPTTQRRRPQPSATLVDVSRIRSQTEKVTVRAMGTVVPVKSIQLVSRVSGQIVEVSPQFVPGGRFHVNDQILQVEQKDYRLAVEQHKSDLIKAEHDLKLEMGQQSVAQREYEILARDVREEDKELLLRQPQLEMARAAVSAAEASLEKALLDLQRTAIVAPFNAMVQSKNVDLGSQASTGAVLASLVGTDEYWVEVSVPVNELKWISIPGHNNKNGAPVRVFYESAWGQNTFLLGTVERLMTDLEPQGRMARLLVTVKDPLMLQSSTENPYPLILGSYVRVEIEGIELPDIVRIPRTALREGNHVWIMSPEAKLDIQTVTPVWSGSDHIYISEGLADGELLITSNLGAPLPGMTLRAIDSPQPASSEQEDEKIPAKKTENQP
jgi:RND family efflux transporter MFP subunit